MKYTEKQRRAIEARGHNLIISAGAGSGKTSVLTGRIVGLIEEGADIRHMLICTYTNPAAAEMKERISRALADRAEQTGNERLRAQSEYVGGADICTIHKFAGKIIAENSLHLGIPENLKAAADRTLILMHRAMDEAFEVGYSGELDGFFLLQRRFGGRTDDALKQSALSLYHYLCSRPEKLGFLKRQIARTSQSWVAIYERELRRATLAKLHTIRRSLSRTLDIAIFYDMQKQIPLSREYVIIADELISIFESGGNIALACAQVKMKAKARNLEPKEAGEEIGELKKNATAMIKKLSALPEGDLATELAEQREVAQAFYNLLTVFDMEYSRMKLEKGLMDFDDMMHYALQALTLDGVKQRYKSEYDHIFVDEYQDTNPVQDSIIADISRGNNLFTVGDVKQSIYRFRLADPTIFMRKIKDSEGRGHVIRMNENFRSSPTVISGVNEIMSRLMSEDLGEISYDEEALEAGKDFGGDVRMMLTVLNDEETSAELEARSIAGHILELLGQSIEVDGEKRGITYDDICILYRSNYENVRVFSRIFAEYGIPLAAEGSAGEAEIAVFVNLLTILTNECSDIALLSVLRSHIGGFDEQELAQIRLSDTEGTFFTAFYRCALGGIPLSSKCANFLDFLRNMRLQALRPSDEFLMYIKNETCFEEVLLAGRFPEKATAFNAFVESLTELDFTDLQSVVDHLTLIYRLNGKYTNTRSQDNSEFTGVRMSTIHASKGLEFPVVILARTSSKFNTEDLNARLLFHSNLGIASDIFDMEEARRLPTLSRAVVSDALLCELKSEELRILYVALTRAQHRLVLSGVITEKALDGFIDEDIQGKLRMLDWLRYAVADINRNSDFFIETQIIREHARPNKAQHNCEFDMESALAQALTLPPRPFYEYTKTPVVSKVGVSSLLPEYGEEETQTSTKASGGGAALGTLVHLFLQHVDFHKKSQGQLRTQLDSLLQRNIISASERAMLIKLLPKVEGFLQSNIAYKIREAKRVLREQSFSMSVDASELDLAQQGGSVIVQGVIDLIFEDDEGVHILDYKSNFADEHSVSGLLAKYRHQLDFYERAVQAITGKQVAGKYIYFLRMNECYDMRKLS